MERWLRSDRNNHLRTPSIFWVSHLKTLTLFTWKDTMNKEMPYAQINQDKKIFTTPPPFSIESRRRRSLIFCFAYLNSNIFNLFRLTDIYVFTTNRFHCVTLGWRGSIQFANWLGLLYLCKASCLFAIDDELEVELEKNFYDNIWEECTWNMKYTLWLRYLTW